MSKRDEKLLLEDIIVSIDRVFTYTSGLSFDDFITDEKTNDAVIRNFEIIGEAVRQLSDEFKSVYPDIEWHKISAVRNRVIHEYFGVDDAIIWSIITFDLPLFRDQVKNIIRLAS